MAGHSRNLGQILTAAGRSIGLSRLDRQVRWKGPLNITPRRRDEGVVTGALSAEGIIFLNSRQYGPLQLEHIPSLGSATYLRVESADNTMER